MRGENLTPRFVKMQGARLYLRKTTNLHYAALRRIFLLTHNCA
jgi:hypothetical protein